MTSIAELDVSIDAVIVAVTDGQPRLLVVDGNATAPAPALPSGPLDLTGDPTLELAMRRCVREQTGIELGYAEQLYTFGDRDRARGLGGTRAISLAYLALVEEMHTEHDADWLEIYDLFPWEDHREGAPSVISEQIRPWLHDWAGGDADLRDRVQFAFGPPWDGIRAVERYELLYQANLVAEAQTDRGDGPAAGFGRPLRFDHRRIAAVALSRLRGKLTYRPVVFELLPAEFTLLALQRTVEALAGVTLHKQNFRRLVERDGLVEGTGEFEKSGPGRPAELHRYRPTVVLERTQPGIGHHNL